jgi:hypothetical protein
LLSDIVLLPVPEPALAAQVVVSSRSRTACNKTRGVNGL